MKDKLLICIPSLRLGGAAKIALNLSEYFVDQHVQVTLVLTGNAGSEREFDDIPLGTKVLRLPESSMHRFLVPFFKAFHLSKIIKNTKPGAIMCVRHDATVIGYLAWKLASKPCGFFIRDINPITKTIKRNFVMVSLIKRAYKCASAIVANSLDVSNALKSKRWVNSNNIHVIDNPVIGKKFYALANAALDQSHVSTLTIPLIVSIGRLDLMKDHETLIRSFSKVVKTINSQLIIIGDGPLKAHLQSLINSLGLQEFVRLAGAIENPYPILNHAEIFVLSSKYEGFGNVLVEALALGKKVISTNCPGGPAYILKGGKFGSLIQVGNVEDLAEALEKNLTANVEPQPLIARSQDFSTELIGKKYHELMFESN
jgi:glycosyltransferase involved in cell wall biosynthesis